MELLFLWNIGRDSDRSFEAVVIVVEEILMLSS